MIDRYISRFLSFTFMEKHKIQKIKRLILKAVDVWFSHISINRSVILMCLIVLISIVWKFNWEEI